MWGNRNIDSPQVQQLKIISVLSVFLFFDYCLEGLFIFKNRESAGGAGTFSLQNNFEKIILPYLSML